MELEVLSKIENKLLQRLEVYFIVKYPNSATPPRAEIRKKLSALLNVDENLTFIRFIKPRAGSHVAYCLACIYNSREQALFVEPKHIIVRNEGKKEE